MLPDIDVDGSGESGEGPGGGRRPAGHPWSTAAALASLVLLSLSYPGSSSNRAPSTARQAAPDGPTDVRLTAIAERTSPPRTATVHGLVVDSDGEPLEAVLVTIQRIGTSGSAGLATISNRSTGTFRLELPPGGWRLYFHRIGYRPATVRLVVRSREPVPRLHIRLRDAARATAPLSLAAAGRSTTGTRAITACGPEWVSRSPWAGAPTVLPSSGRTAASHLASG